MKKFKNMNFNQNLYKKQNSLTNFIKKSLSVILSLLLAFFVVPFPIVNAELYDEITAIKIIEDLDFTVKKIECTAEKCIADTCKASSDTISLVAIIAAYNVIKKVLKDAITNLLIIDKIAEDAKNEMKNQEFKVACTKQGLAKGFFRATIEIISKAITAKNKIDETFKKLPNTSTDLPTYDVVKKAAEHTRKAVARDSDTIKKILKKYPFFRAELKNEIVEFILSLYFIFSDDD